MSDSEFLQMLELRSPTLQAFDKTMRALGVDPDTREAIEPVPFETIQLEPVTINAPSETKTPEVKRVETLPPLSEQPLVRVQNMVAGATLDAVKRGTSAIEDFLEWTGMTIPPLLGFEPQRLPGKRLSEHVEAFTNMIVPEPKTKGEAIMRDILAIVGPGGVATKGLQALGVSAKAASFAGGAIADAAFVDPESPLLVEAIGLLPPVFQEDVQRYLNGKMTDEEYRQTLSARLARRGLGAVEGGVVGVAIDGLTKFFGMFKRGKEAVNELAMLPEGQSTTRIFREGRTLQPPAGPNAPKPKELPAGPTRKALPEGQTAELMIREGRLIQRTGVEPGVTKALVDVHNAKLGMQPRPIDLVKKPIDEVTQANLVKVMNADPDTFDAVFEVLKITPPDITKARDLLRKTLDNSGLNQRDVLRISRDINLESLKSKDDVISQVRDMTAARAGQAPVDVDLTEAMTPEQRKIHEPFADDVARFLNVDPKTALSIAGAAILGAGVFEDNEIEASPLRDVLTVIRERARLFADPERAVKSIDEMKRGRYPAASVVQEGKAMFEHVKDGDDIEKIIEHFSPKDVPNSRPVSDEELAKLTARLGFNKTEFEKFARGSVPLSRMTRGALEALSASEAKLKEIAKRVKGGDDAARLELAKQFAIHSDIARASAGLSSELGRSMRILQLDPEGNLRYLTELEGRLKAKGTATGASVDDLASAILDMNSSTVARFAIESTDPTVGGAIREYWINSILSSPKTMIANLAGNTFTTLWNIPERFVTGTLAHAAGGDIRATEGLHLVYGLLEGFGDALSVAAESLRQGRSLTGAAKFESERIPQISSKLLGGDSALGVAADWMGTLVRTPGSILNATDAFFYTWNYRAELRALAYRMQPDDIAGFLKNPPPEAVRQAMNASDVLTFTNALSDPNAGFQFFRNAAQKLEMQKAQHPVMTFVTPFVRTPVNLATYAAERTPGLAFLSKKFWSDMTSGDMNRAAMATGKVMTSSMMGAGVTYLATQGRITGGGPADPDLNRLWRADHQPFSIRIGDKWVSYEREDPLGLMLGAYATLAEAVHEGVDINEAVTGLTLGFAEMFSNKTYVRGLTELLDAVRGGKGGNQDVFTTASRIGVNTLGAFIPNIVAEARRTSDPYRRDVETLMDSFKNRSPFHSTTLPPQRNFFGEKVAYGYGFGPDVINAAYRFISPVTLGKANDDPVIKELIDNEIVVDMHKPNVNGVPLTPKEFDEYVVRIGQTKRHGMTMKEALNRLIEDDTYKRGTKGKDGTKAALIRSVVTFYRQVAQAEMLTEHEDIRTKAQTKMEERFGITPARPATVDEMRKRFGVK